MGVNKPYPTLPIVGRFCKAELEHFNRIDYNFRAIEPSLIKQI